VDIRDNVPPLQILGGRVPPVPYGSTPLTDCVSVCRSEPAAVIKKVIGEGIKVKVVELGLKVELSEHNKISIKVSSLQISEHLNSFIYTTSRQRSIQRKDQEAFVRLCSHHTSAT